MRYLAPSGKPFPDAKRKTIQALPILVVKK